MSADVEMVGSIGAAEWLWVALFVLLLLVGSKKLPELAKALGRATGEFQKGQMEIKREIREAGHRSAAVDPGYAKLERAAKDLGIETTGKTVQQLREEITRAVSS